jgi:phage portal protein BeeE
MDYVESAEQLRDNVLALFHVPAVSAGIVRNVTFGAILAANVNFCSVAVNPLLRMMSRTITEKLARPHYGDDTDGLVGRHHARTTPRRSRSSSRRT